MARVSHRVLTALPAADAKEPMALACLVRLVSLSAEQVKDSVDRLSKRGLVLHERLARYRRSGAGDAFIAAGHQVKPGSTPGGTRPLRRDRAEGGDTLRDRAWSALRQLRKATLPELIELAGEGNEKDPVGNVRVYLRRLAGFGLVAALKKRAPGMAPTSNGFQQWVLVRDLGPKAPIWLTRQKKLIDRNTGEELKP
jgi:hypothetical protein